MTDPDLSLGAAEDRTHRAELDLIDEMGGEFLRHEDFHQGIRAAARVVLARIEAEMAEWPSTPGSLIVRRIAKEAGLDA